MSSEKETEIGHFKTVVASILQTLNKDTNEKELRKAYREEKGHNINIVLDKVSKFCFLLTLNYFNVLQLELGQLIPFLRYHCQSFCIVQTRDHVVRIHRVVAETIDDDVEKKTKREKRLNKKSTTNSNMPTIK